MDVLFLAEFFGSFLFFFILAALYEGLKFYREVLHRYAMKKRKQIRDTDATDNEQLRSARCAQVHVSKST